MQANCQNPSGSYNRYLAIAARAVRRSLKEDKRIIAERRGESELRVAKWQVSQRWCRGDDRQVRGMDGWMD